MAGDKFDQLYNALKADGAVSGTREHFRQFVYAPGKQGYHNRKQLYDALYADGAVSSKSYEEFAQRLGLHAVNPKPQQQKPLTMKQRAQQVAQEYLHGKKQSVDYLHRPQSQMGRPQRNVPENASPFVRSLYEIDNAKKGPDYSVDYTSPKATQQVYKQNQQVRKQAAQSAIDHVANDEYRRQSRPMIDNGTVGVMKPMGEIEQEMSDSASKFVDANLGDYISKAVLGEQNASAQRGLDASNRVPLQAGAGGMGLMVKGMAYNEQVDPDLMAKNLTDNARDGFLKLFQDPNFVAKVENEATRLGVTPEAYMESIIPHLKDRLATSLHESEYQKALPKNMLDNIANRFIDSNTIGKALRLATQTRGQRILNEQASAATADGKNPYYKGGTVENVTADVAGMVADPIFGASAKLGGAVAGKLIGNSTKLAALMANGNLAQRLMARGAQAVTSGGVTGFVFDSTGSVIQNYSTGEDTSLGNTLKVAAKGGATGAVNFATMSLAGIPLSEVGRSVGLKAIKGGSFWGNAGRATAKVGLESGKTYMEAMGMYLGGYVSGKLEGRTDANGKPIEFDLWNGTMESLPTAIGFRLQHAVEGLRGGRKNEKGEDMGWFGSTIANFKDFLTSDKAKESRFLMTDDERNQIFSSGAMNGLMPDGENIVSYAKRTKNKKVSYEDPYLETDASMIKNTYDQIMADPKVSWDAKAKFSAMVTGIMPSARPMMDYITYSSEDYVKDGLLRGKRKYVNEYSAKGELLSKIPYDSKVDRDNVVYKHNIVRENQRLYNAMGLLARQDRNNYELQNDFFVENMKKPGADVNILVTNMGDEGSHVFRDFSLFALNSEKGTVLKTIYSVAVRNGMKSEDLIKAMKKNPMKRSDFEQNVCVELRRALEAKAFPDGKVHAEQSNLNGKDIAEDNSLGTEQPNGDAVKQELNGLRQAEAEMDALIRDNDIFSQNFKKLQSQGLTNPQIYDWMVQQGGLTVEQLEPFAHYINANARVQGMQEATKQKIEETVSVFAQDWSYHGTLNGKAMNGEQALYVQDSNGRTLLVGSGDVAFDQTTGRAKEGSGDMLVCLDPNTNEMVYVKADEVTLLKNQPIDQFAAEYRQRLQMKNSEPYNQVAQEQAMQDAAKPQQDQEAPQDNTTNEDNLHGKDSDIIREFDTKRGKHVVVRKVYSENDKLKVTKIEAKADDGTGVSSVYEYFPLPDEYEIRPIDIEAMEEGGTKVLGVNELRENKRGTYADGTDLTDAGAKVVVKFEDGSIGSLDVGLIRKNEKPAEQPHPSRKFADGTEVPMTTDSKGRPTPDYASMTPEQSAEILTEDFGENAEKVVDGQIKKAENALKDAEKMKVDYTAEPNDIMEQEDLKKKTVEAAKQQLDHAQNIKKAMTAKKVAETVGKTEQTEGAHEAGVVSPKVKERFDASKKIKGRRGSITLADGTKIRGTYYYGETSGLTTSHDPFNDFKQSEGFPVNEDGTSSNSRSYRDKESRLFTQKIGNDFNGLALKNVPVVQEGITLSGNGTVMGKKLAEQAGKDSKYYEDLEDNAEGFGWTPEQIKGAGFKGIVYFVPDEKLPLNSKTFDLFNKKETKSESNTEQAVKNAKTLTSDEVGAIVAEIEGNGSLEAFFNNSKAINDLVKTLVDKGIIGQNEVAQMMDSPERLSAQGREYVKNLLLGSIFKPETIRMLGIDSTVKNKAINAIRSVMDNMKLGEFSLRDEIDQAIQLLYEARQGGNKVDTLLRTPDMFGEDAAKRYSSISQMMALALEGKVSDFRDLLDEYNRIAKARNTGEGSIFEEAPTKEELIKEFLDFKKWQDYGTGHSENEGVNDVSGVEEPKQEASGENEPAEAGEGRVKSDLDRITETDEEFEVEGKYGTIYKKKYLIDGDKEVMKVDEPNKNGDYTGSYYEYNGKKYGDLRGVFEHLDDKPDTGSEEMPEGPIYDRKKALIDEINESDIKKKDDAFQILYKAEDLLDDYYGIPHDEWRQEPSRSNTIAGILSMARNALDRIKNEPVEPATEKQLSYLERLTSDDPTTRKLLEGVKLNKKQATWLIGNIKGLNDNLMRLHPDDIAETEKFIHDGIEYMKKLNGETYDEGGLPLLPKKENPDPTFDPIAAAAAEFKKEHPLTEDEIMKADVDDLSKDMALDYLNGEVTDDLHRAIYESIFAKTRGQKAEPKVETPKTEPSADPMEGIKNAAEGFEKEKKAKVETEKKPQQKADDAAVAASNKKVNDLWKELMNAGKDEMSASFIGLNSKQLEVLPKLVSAMAENAYLKIKRGMHNLEDVVKEMRKEFAPAAKIFKKEDVDAIYEQMMNIRYRDGEQRMSLKDWADYYEKTSPKHQENLVGDSKTAEERKMAEKKFIDVVNLQLGFKHKFNGIVELRKIAERVGLNDIKDTDLQELAETAIVKRARGIASSESTNDSNKFELIKKLYENQPSLNQRDSERVMKGQFSTPAPYAFVADMYVKGNGKVIESVLEPSAGNGMLTIGFPMDKVHVNDIDAQRLANLRRQGFKNVTSQDGTQPFADKDVDVVVTNPPFGSATPKEYDGYKISSLEGQMAINALESMKDDGRAAIIIGGKTEYAKNGSLNPKDKAFLGYLYSHYNVEDVINVDGSLFAKQGTTFPTRMILINGRRNYDPEHKVFPPVEKDARAETVKDYDELYKRIEDDILRSTEQPVDIRRKEKREGDKPSGRKNVSDSTEENGGRGRLGTTTVHDGTSENSEPTELDPSTRPVGQSEDADGRPVEATGNGDSNTDGRGGQNSVSKSGPADGGSERGGNEPSGGNEPLRNDNGENGREPGVRHGSGHIQQQLENTPKEEKKQSLTTEKVKYQPHSAAYSIGAVVPARQKEALDNVLNKLGDADQYLVDNLGYNDKEDLYAHLAAEQIDAVALGLKQMEKGNGFIIGDQTGIGKGRQAAAIIRYAVKQGRIPISFTQKANLFSDTYRDLNDIGSPELRPFILASSNEGNIKVNYDEEVKGLDGQTTTVRKQKVVYKVPSKTETERVLKYIAENGKLPEGYDYILTTYSQIRNGMEEFKGGKWKAKKKVTATDRNGQMKRDAIKRIAENSVFILDESHDAAGEGSGSAFIQEVLPKVKGVTFLSATYAKTPDAMKLYALKTDLGSKNKEEGEKGDASWKVLNAIKKGGAVFQEIMSQALTKSGQMIRRERDMTGVTIDWIPLTENEVEIQSQRDKFDNIFGIFNDILNFQRTYVDAKLGQMSDDLAFIQGSVDHTPGTKDMGIGNVTFASKAYNVVQQALFSIKAEKVADYAIEAIKNGEKPVIAVNNTMGSMIDEYPMGVEMDMPDLNSTLMKGLEGILRYTEKNDMGDQVNSTLRVEELGEEAVARYNEIKQKIASVSSGLSISPIDVIKHRLEEAGYKVGELTGRNTEMAYTENGKVIRKNRTDKNKNALADRFNNGDLDALILNRSAAAGISLHASSKYKDQRQRTMIFAQMQGNINDEVQIRGRIDRTGQVRRGKYVYLVSAIPAEQRLMMMFKNKLKSLDANTTSSQKSKFNEVDVQDFTNKYGDEIVLQYMAQHPEYYNKLADPLGWGFMEYAKDGLSIGELKSSMKSNITSPSYEVMKRLTLLPVKEQEVVLKDISDSYSQKIKQLNDMGMNDLEMTDMPLEAKTLKREVWKEGSDPDGDNAFADNTYIETVEMNVLKKPMKAEEVEAAQKKMLDGKDYETWRKDKVAEIRAHQQAKIEDTKAKMAEQTEKKVAKVEESTRIALERENAKIQKKIDKGEELKPGEHVLTEEEIKTRVDTAVDDVKRRLSKKLSDAIKNVNVKYDMFVNPLFAFDPNKTISVPNDWYVEEASTSLYPEFGRVIGFKYDKNYNLGSSSIVIATTDSRKRVEIPLNRTAVFERIQADSERFSKECKVVNMVAWNRMIPKKDRTTGRIITGNMLEALADNSSIGHLISYTTDDGKVKQGILVPDGVSIAEITGNMPIAKAYDWFTKKTSGTELASTDGTLRLTKNFGSMYTLFVPASRKEGGKYYLNQDLLDLVHGHNFQSKGKNFWATFDAEKLKDVLNVLNGMGVEVKTPYDYSESDTHFREDRGLQYSKTDTKDVKNSRIIPEDVDKNVSSQIEKRFDDEVERLYGDSSEKPNIEKEANKYAEKQYIDTFEYDKKGNPIQKYEGLKSVIDSLDSKLKDIEQKYGFNRKSDINEIKRAIGTETAEGNDSRGMGGVPQGDSVRISGRKGVLSDYKETALSLAAAQRAKEYLLERYDNIRLKYGLEDGDWASKEQVEKIFNDYNSDADVKKIFERIAGLVDVLGTKLKGEAYTKVNVEGYYYHPKNYILIDTDLLSAIRFGKQELASAICHEMLHVVTSDIINLYRKGHGDLLNERQRKAAKEVVDLYDKINSYFERHFDGAKPYALTNPAEMITELANPTWRRIAAQMPVAKGWFRSFIASVRNMLGFPPKVSALDRLDKALENVIRNLDYGVFQKGAELNDEIVNKKASIPVSSHITQLSEKTGGKVNMVSSVDEITNKAARAAIEDGRKITGWYDEKTGEVHLYMPNIHDRYTAEKTIWHEVVGHKGMRELFGDERFDKFLREVWYDLDKPENAALKKLVDEERKFNPLNIYDAIEEGIARLAEDGKGEAGFWNGIKNKVSDFLHEIGYRIAPNTKDVKYLLWLSKNLQKNPNDPYWKMRAEAVKYRLDHERMPAVVAHDGMFYGNDGKVRSMDNLTKAEWNEATDGEIHFRTTPSAGTALDRYHRSLDEHGYMFTESYMDNMLSLKKLMNAIVPDKKIEDIASSENPYILQNTMQGAMSDAAQMFERNVMKPLDKAMADLLDAFDGKKDDEKIRNFNLYMITKHGLERNRILYVRDALKYMRMNEKTKKLADTVEFDWNNEKATLDEKLERGDIDLKTYYERMDDFIRTYVDSDNKFDAGEHDYSGIHAIQEVAKSSDPYNDAEAIQSVMDSEAKMESIKKGSVKDYWDKVKAATQYSIDTDYKNGLISRELYGHVSDMFNWYVPLRKYDEATAEDTYGYITEQGDPKSYIGSTIMRARGHKYLSETNVLAQIGAMGNRAIKNGGMNAIRQAFARFVRNNPNNNLVTETRVWYADDPITHTTVERYPDIPEGATADEINQIVADFNMEMKDLESKGLATKVYRRGRIGYKFQRAENKSQHIVDVKIAGRTHTFIINGNPRAAQALNGLLENSGAKGIMKPLSSISRMMAQLCTSYNPEFVMRNIMRDAEFASSNVTSKEGARYGALWAKYYAQLGLYKGASNISFKDLSGTTGLGLFAKYRNGTLDTSDKVQRYFKEFMENGGETGWVQIKNMKDWTKEYKKDVKSERSKIDKGGAALRDFFFGNLSNINEVAENIARFATYCASRDSNRSVIRSVYDAKEVSTNFNRHGSGDAIKSFKNGEMTGGKAAARWAYGFTASYLRHCSMFFNAGIQSTNLLVKNLKNHPVGTSINMLAIPFALGALAALGNNVLIASEDEKDRNGVKDPYGELPDYVRRNNLCIYKGGGQFVTIPLAIELRAFYGLGDLAAGLTFSPNVSGQKNPALDAVGCMSQLVPVMDYLGNSSAGKEPLNETIKAISPSALSPFVEWELNTDWKGAPIERRGDWNENSPAWQRSYKGVPDGYIAVNKWVNAQTNDVAKGNDDMLGNSFLDMVTNPSMLNHYIGGIGGGAATFTERAIGVIKHGSDTETKDIPFLRSLLYTPSEQSSLQRTKSKWYNYKDEMEKTMANVDRLKSKNVPIDKRITNIGEYYHFQNSKEAAKVRVIELAEKQMNRWKKMRDKASDTESINFANQNIDRIMMDAVDELDRLE